MAVVVYHFNGAIQEYSSQWLANWIEIVFSYGYLGVDVFFVLSGFVISYSVSKFKPSLQFLGRFALRRSIRLDPPYWLTICAEILLLFFATRYLSAYITQGVPEWRQVLSHLLYAQDLMGYGGILSIFWTLCFEIQFYLFFVFSLIGYGVLSRSLQSDRLNTLWKVLAAALFVYSLASFFLPAVTVLDGLFVPRWFQFFLGFLAMRVVISDKLSWEFVAAAAAILFCSATYSSGADNGLTAVFTATFLVLAGLKDKMGDWLSSEVNQFFGRISYSLYLVHLVIGWRVIKVLGLSLGHSPSQVALISIFLAGIVASVFSAWLMYRLVEAPSLQVCHQVALDQRLSWSKIRSALPSLQLTSTRKNRK